MTRATRLLLATAAVCTAALWSMAAMIASPAAVGMTDAVAGTASTTVDAVEAEVSDLTSGPTARLAEARQAPVRAEVRLLVAVLVAAAVVACVGWIARTERAALAVVRARVPAPRIGSRAPPRT